MTNYDEGNRTSQWFWIMLTNLGLNGMDDDHFDEYEANRIIDRFLNREYEADGSEGGIFVLEKPFRDLRDVELWIQANWFIGEYDGYL